ncbi:hypothetical protein [Streptomyces sp. BK340]|uniref:hypothetical protein n=1 Tax=Streptomyces sp. BK340 TaxID=2572903 RepID=UPI00119D1B9E|nr:hypothetical protein [Streptomyces sp. BK340]TVZ96475.1 hypothetical protein FB157_103386 [Streptomyces sp. BK340]
MPWVKLDDRFPSHRKVALLPDRAFRLHVSAICWCSENLTDGRIADRELPLVAKVRGLKAAAQQLVDAGLWDRIEGGWEIHDYLDYNPSRAQVLAERKKNAERQERFRQRRNGKPVPPDGNGVTPDPSDAPGMHDGDTNAARRRHDGDTTTLRMRPVSETEPQVSELRNGVTNDAPSRPVPQPLSMADVGGGSAASSSVDLDAYAPSPIDDDGFALNDGLRRWALSTFGPGLDLDYETAQFLDHFRGNGQRRKNWNTEWQKWIRRSAKFASERASRPPLRAVSGGYQPYKQPSPEDYANDLGYF